MHLETAATADVPGFTPLYCCFPTYYLVERRRAHFELAATADEKLDLSAPSLVSQTDGIKPL